MTMEQEIIALDEGMKAEVKEVKDKYSKLKSDVKKKYKNIEAKKKKQEKEETNKLRKSIPKSLKILVWDKNIGKEKGIGECDVCKSNIDSKNFECGHIISVKYGGETNIENLLPICSSCNKSMGPQNLLEFKEKYFKQKMNTKKIDETKVDKYIQRNLCRTNETKPVKIDGFVVNIFGEKPLFLSTDDIFHNYREWLCTYHNEYYNETQYEQCFGESNDRNELVIKLTKVYGELTNNPHLLNNGSMGDFITKKGYGFTHIKYVN
jgi:5-methylcytosine-specific restriction endonuclease McrA